jgi:hypothetical protein
MEDDMQHQLKLKDMKREELELQVQQLEKQVNILKVTCFSSSSTLITISVVETTCFHHVVIKIRQLFLRPAACLTSTLLELERVLTTANAARANDLTCLPKHGGARDNKFLVINQMTDQCCLTSTIACRSALTAGTSNSSIH